MTQDFDQLKKKWLCWLETLSANIKGLYHYRMVMRRVSDIVNNNPKLRRNLLSHWMYHNYDVTTLVAIRRLMDKDQRTVSLPRLVAEIKEHASQYTREQFVVDDVRRIPEDAICVQQHLIENYFPDGSTMTVDHGQTRYDEKIEDILTGANEMFDDFSSPNCGTLCPAKLQQHLDRTTTATDKVKDIVDQHLAHLDGNSSVSTLTFGETDEAIEAIGDLYQHLSRLLTGHAPELEWDREVDWEWVFYEPWACRSQR